MIFIGLLTVYSSRGLEKSERWAWTIAKGVGMFMIPFGLVAAILEVIPLLIFRQEFKEGLP